MTNAAAFWRKYGVGYLFIVPAAVLYLTFVIYPFLQSVYLSLTEWNGADPIKRFIGLANYVRMAQDELVRMSLSHNLIWMVLGTTLPIGLGLLLAVMLWSQPWGYTLFRTFYFMPEVIAPAIVAVIWGWIYAARNGILNRLLEAVGLESWTRGWLGDPSVALLAVIGVAVWSSIGFYFVILLAGLQNVDVTLLDAARIDGANGWQTFWNVTVPQLSHVLTLVTVLALINAFKAFDTVFILTQGGPANRTELIATYTYKKAFMQNEVGYAAALAMLITALALIASVVTLRLREQGEG